MPRYYQFNIEGMTCSSCSNSIETVLKNCLSDDFVVKSARVVLAHKRAYVTVSDTMCDDVKIKKKLSEIITDASFTVIPEVAEEIPKHNRSHLIQGTFGGALGIVLLVLNSLGFGIPFAAMCAIAGFSALLTFLLGRESYVDAAKKLKNGKTATQKLSMDSLITISAWSAIGISIASLFVPGLPMLCDAALLTVAFRHIGKAVRQSVEKKINAGLSFCENLPPEIDMETQEGMKSTSIHELKVGDVIVVKPGEIIPVDGVSLNDSCVDAEIIDGSKGLRQIKNNDELLAGMFVPIEHAPIRIKITKSFKDSNLVQEDERVIAAQIDKSPLELKTEKITSYFVLGVLGVALTVGIVVGVLFSPALAIQCALTILVSACPCTLGFIVPWATKIGMAKAAKEHIEFKNNEALQTADQIDTVVFDLNGTLTKGIFEVQSFKRINEAVPEEELLKLVARLEKNTRNVIGRSLISYVKNKGIRIDDMGAVDIVQQDAGVLAVIDGDQYAVGNEAMLDASEKEKYQEVIASGQVAFLIKNNKVIGYFKIHEPLCDDAAAALLALQNNKKRLRLCSGASESTINLYVAQLKAKGIEFDEVKSKCYGNENKRAYIASLKTSGCKVAMVGDGPNDKAAICESNIGFALHSRNSDAQTESMAKVVVKNLLSIPKAFAIAEQTVSNIKQNLMGSFAFNSGMLALVVAASFVTAIAFMLNPGIGAALMVAQASLILLNAYRFKQKSVPTFEMEMSETTRPSSSTSYLFNHGMEPNLCKKMQVTPQTVPQNMSLVSEEKRLEEFRETRQLLLGR